MTSNCKKQSNVATSQISVTSHVTTELKRLQHHAVSSCVVVATRYLEDITAA